SLTSARSGIDAVELPACTTAHVVGPSPPEVARVHLRDVLGLRILRDAEAARQDPPALSRVRGSSGCLAALLSGGARKDRGPRSRVRRTRLRMRPLSGAEQPSGKALRAMRRSDRGR